MTTSPAYQRGLVLYEQGRTRDAADRFRETLAIAPDDAAAHAMLSLCLTRDDALADATREAELAISHDPDFPLGFYALAAAMVSRNRDEEARTAIDSAIALDRTNSDYHGLLAQLHLRKSLWRMALHAADEGLVFDPRHSLCLNIRANALVHLGEREAAAATMRDALQDDPEDTHLHANQGWALLHHGQPRDAMTHFREALRLDPNNDWAKAGVVESLKASFFLYRWLLRFLLWLSRFTPRTQNLIVIVGFFGYQGLRAVVDNNPALRPFVLPILIAYSVFTLSTWLASTLLNVLLRFHPVGKHVLSTADRRTSELVVGLLLATIGCVVAAFVMVEPDRPITLAFAFFLTALPASRIFYAPERWPRWTTAAIAAGVLSLGFYASINLAAQPFYNFITAAIVSQFATMFLLQAHPKR